jgi:two-component system, cell cycle sensor histidine kinase and response regulator CckA
MTTLGRRKDRELLHAEAELARLRARIADLEGARGKDTHSGEGRMVSRTMPRTKPSANEAKVFDDEQLLAVTLDSIADAVITTDANGQVRRINPIAERLTGWRGEQAIGRPLAEVFCVGAGPRGGEPAGPASTSGAHSSTTLEPVTLWDRQGNPHSIEISASSIRDSNSESHGTVIVFRDVTQRRELEAKKVQTDKLQALSQLVGGLAHEFNNLLAGTMNFAELLRLRMADRGDVDAIQFADGITENTRRASGLVGRLLAFARERPRESAPVDLHVLLDDLLEEFAPECLPDVSVEVRANAPDAFVRGDAQALRDALLNLLTNAREAMSSGGRLTITTDIALLDEAYCQKSILPIKKGRYLRVDVEDSGIGIQPQLQGRIFEPFFTTKRTGQASGLGLSVVYGTIRDHGGSLEVESAPSVGTRVRVLLPLPSEVPVESLRPSHEVVRGAGRLLVADDEPSLRRSTGALLRRLGYEVVLAEDGAQAVELFRADPSSFDLVLLDIIMPKMNGRDALRELRRISPNVKALYVSAFGLGSEDPATEDGVGGVIRKPFTAAVLSQRIANALQTDP